ncbi:hypothetical protein ASD12_18075 [Mesorhizobium sp. Root102]|uniref:hypothetical protein n=1 Tax=Mesorhizobium sp. Root102 TaxID=1736422 RepID=UPI0007008CDB|nr:hypothetical protein [Mesorhizobium sp. Root102]KQU77708.1 hypothetical protein ASD12_18075 [Mesorhizobium sp. Root102]
MSSYLPIVKNGAAGAIFYVSLAPRTANGQWQSNPTFAAGDVKISLDGGALANLNTLPVVTPASSKLVKVTLSQAETNSDNITIIFSDAAGAEWCDLTINLQTAAKQFDDLATQASVDAVQSDTNDIQTRVPAALVSGRIDASVGAMANDVLTNAAIAADAIGSGELATSAVTEIQSGLATDSAVATLQTSVDDLPTNEELTTALAGADDAVLAQVALVKAKTDNLPADPADASDIAAAFVSLASHGDSAWSTATGFSTLDAAAVNAEVGTALVDAGVTMARMAHLDADVSTRLPASGYTAPDNASIATIDGKATTILAGVVAIDSKTANLPSDPADQSLVIAAADAVMARLGAPAGVSLSADVGAVKADTGAVKTKTDSLSFTVSGQVDANMQSINDTLLTGDGSTGDKFGPAP